MLRIARSLAQGASYAVFSLQLSADSSTWLSLEQYQPCAPLHGAKSRPHFAFLFLCSLTIRSLPFPSLQYPALCTWTLCFRAAHSVHLPLRSF